MMDCHFCEMCGQMFSTDEFILPKDKDKEDQYKVACNKDTRAHTIRGVYSGTSVAIFGNIGETQTLRDNFIWFAGIEVNEQRVRHALVKTDNAPALIKAIKEMGWIPEPSIAKRWPHNRIHARRHGNFLCVCRSSMQQSGFPIKCWNWVCMYACVAINVTRLAPKLPNGLTSVGDSRPTFEEKHSRTSWEVWHNG